VPRVVRLPLAWRRAAPAAMVVGLLLADAVAWALSASVVYAVRALVWGELPFLTLTLLTSVLWIAARLYAGLYPGVGLAPPLELRRAVLTSVVAAVGHAALLVAAGAFTPQRLFGLATWLVVLPLSWALRGAAKSLLIRARLFGYPIIVVGAGEKGERAVRELRANPELGFFPIAVFDDDPAKRGTLVCDAPVVGTVAECTAWTAPYPVRHAMLALARGEADAPTLTALARGLAARYPNVQLFPDLAGLANLWVRAVPVGAYLALEIPHARFRDGDYRVKRAFDLAVSVPLLVLTAPIVAVAAALVKLISPGPAFFRQDREGRGGKPVGVWKIRTMVPNAEQRLAEYLRDDEAARFEWERFLKLRKDPRIVPVVGAFLRRSSIDELPQLWNVVRGDMSLVGPRIFALWHVARFRPEFRELRHEVPPGMTGLWQVNHRNSGDLSVQEIADSYYIHNWSLWLDLWILLRTVRVVLWGKGAY
jgi:Undecaprenyl-phosphate galactose phosphotransferase WbaP